LILAAPLVNLFFPPVGKSSRNQAVDPQTRRYAEAAKQFEQFIEQEKGQDGGRQISRDRGRG
jgi:hypothetical protein